jgi:predicted DNA-binding transcriptional regulator AlpA
MVINSDTNDKKNQVELIRMTTAMSRYDLSRDTFDLAVNRRELEKFKRGRATFLDANAIDRWIMGETVAA